VTSVYRATLLTVGAVLAALLFALVYTLGYVSNNGGGDGGRTDSVEVDGNQVIIDDDVDFETLDQILNILRREYLERDNLDAQALYEAAIRGMLDSLADTGTFYIDPTTNQLAIGPSGSFEGIGATVSEQGGQIIIVSPFQGSPAEAAGIKSGDIILTVDGESTEGWPVDKAVLKIRGPKGTEVTLTIRHLDGAEAEFTITRDEVQVDSVSATPPGGILRDASGSEVTDIAYLRISEFTQRTPVEVEEILGEVEASGKQGLIIDLRVNPGGLLQETVDTADLFLDEGVILIEVDRDDNETFYRARPGGAALDVAIVILQDEFSASGAEVLAAALQDNGRAVVIGEKSFGKGTVNISQGLRDGGALFVTIRRWLTPDGVQIDGVGIRPDIEVTPGPLDPDYDPLQDLQLQRAIDHLRGLETSEEPVPSSTTP
jgi:carboxyl-terminal processing protease